MCIHPWQKNIEVWKTQDLPQVPYLGDFCRLLRSYNPDPLQAYCTQFNPPKEKVKSRHKTYEQSIEVKHTTLLRTLVQRFERL